MFKTKHRGVEGVCIGKDEMKVVEFLEFGRPIGYSSTSWPVSSLKNHQGALDYAAEVDKYWVKEVG